MKKDKVPYLIFGIFGIVGVILIIACICMTVSGIKFEKKSEEITGTIAYIEKYYDSDHDRHFRVYVNYEYQGQEYKHVHLNSYSSSMYEGKEITLKVDPENPGRVKTPHSDLFACIILGIMGVVFSLIGIIPTVSGIRKAAKKKELREKGRYIYATVERIGINRGYSVNGVHPFVVYCNYQDEYSGVLYKFKSDNLWTDPYPILQEGSSIRIYVDGQDYSNYHVDVESSLQGRVVDYT